MLWRALFSIDSIHCDFMIRNPISLNMVHMPIVEIVGMAVVFDGCVAAIHPVGVGVALLLRACFSHKMLL